jgi:protein-disulfide isomerase
VERKAFHAEYLDRRRRRRGGGRDCGRVWFGTRPSSPGPVPTAVAQTSDKAKLLQAQPDDHVLGDPKAPVTLIEYASFTCPHCAHFSVAVLPELKKKWVDTAR